MPLSNILKRGLLGMLVLLLANSCTVVHQSKTNHLPEDEVSLSAVDESLYQLPEDAVLDEVFDEALIEVCNEEQTPAETDASIAMEIQGLEALGPWEAGIPQEAPPEEMIANDFPITINRQVQFYLDFFTTKHHDSFSRWLARSSRYLPMIKKELKAAGLPEDLCYLPMIESGFSLTAFSRARAVGPWQFMLATGRRYGLTVNQYVDERRDPEKSTRAAIAYLTDLYDQFGSWYLAVAAYNAGEGKIGRAIKKYNTDDFWELAQGSYLKLETKRYVPKLIAAILIAKDPGAYGFTDIEYAAPLAYDTLEVPRWTSLRATAVACKTPFEEVWDLNRQLRRAITPPETAHYLIKVPAGTRELTAQNLPRVKATVVTDYKTHVIRKGDTIAKICRRYKLNKTTLLKANDLRTATLTPSQRLRIPFQTTVYSLLKTPAGAGRSGPAPASMTNLVLHTIKPGETVSTLAHRYNVPMHLIAAWNELTDLACIRAGQQLALYLQEGSAPTTGFVPGVQQLFSDSPDRVDSGGIILLADGKKKRPASDRMATAPRHTYYQVKGGDSLWKIARKFNITTEEIRRWNKLENNTIWPGNRLLLKIGGDADV